MFCRNCGKPVDDSAKFCANCGMSIDRSKESPTEPQKPGGPAAKGALVPAALILSAAAAAAAAVSISFAVIEKTRYEPVVFETYTASDSSSGTQAEESVPENQDSTVS